MANSDKPFGLRPVRHLNGSPWNGATNKYVVPSGTTITNGLYVGDAVLKLNTGANSAGVPAITAATVGDGQYITGVVVGFEPDYDNLNHNYITANVATTSDRYVYVCDDPDVIFHIQDDGAATLAVTDIVGLNAVLIATHTGATNGYISGMELDTNSDAPDADPSNQLLVLRAAELQGNTAGSANCIWEVLINMHSLRTPATGV